MDINLLSQNPLTILGLLIGSGATLTIYIVSTSYSPLKKHRKEVARTKKIQLAILIISILAAFLLEFLIHLYFRSDKLPNYMWLMILPTTLSVGLFIISLPNKTRWLKWPALIEIFACIIFSLLLINKFYNFYPSLYSVFNLDNEKLLASQTTEIQYTPSKQSTKTVESNLYGQDLSTVGQVHSLVIPGTSSKFKPRLEWVYQPAIASYQSNIKLPVIVLLPGYPGLTYNWLGGGLKKTMDEFAKQHHGITPMIFMVDDTGSTLNDTECVNSPRGNLETYLTVDVPNYIKAHYQVETSAGNWAIGGLSMGGTCSIMLALRHPNVYSHVLDFSGEIGPGVGSKADTIRKLFGGSSTAWEQHQPLYLLKHDNKQYKGMGAFFTIGKSDSKDLIGQTTELYNQTKAAGIESVYVQVAGQHNFQAWEQSFKESLPWISNRLGATECAGACIAGS